MATLFSERGPVIGEDIAETRSSGLR